MKKFKIFATTLIFFMVLVLVTPCFAVFGIAKAQNYNVEYDAEIMSEIYNFVEPNDETSLRHNRIAGTRGEADAAEYIKQRLEFFGLSPVNNQSTQDGEQQFFVQTDDGLKLSRNIVFRKECGVVNAKKIIIATHYDSMWYTSEDNKKFGGEGVSSSGAAVGQVLTLAKIVSALNFNFDVEFVFFGSHFVELAGAKYYTSFVGESEANNILLMINIDKIVGSDNILLYTGEIPYKEKDIVVDGFCVATEAKDASNFTFLADTTQTSVTGLPYTNIALESDNACFIRSNVKTLNILSLKDEDIGALGIVQEKNIIKVQDDNLENIVSRANGKLASNLSNMLNGVLAILDVDDIENKLSCPGNASDYAVFGDKKTVVFAVAILFIVVCFGAYLWKNYFKQVAEKAKQDVSLQKIMSNIDLNKYDNFNDAMDDIMKQIEKLEKENKEKSKKDNSKDDGKKDK